MNKIDEQKTLDAASVSYAGVPGVSRFHDKTKPTSFEASIDVAGGPVRFFVLQPEQIVVARMRLIERGGWTAAEQITLPPRDASDYRDKRNILVHLLQSCCRRPQGRPALMFPGAEGFQKLDKIDDGKLVQLARLVVEFGEFFVAVPQFETRANPIKPSME